MAWRMPSWLLPFLPGANPFGNGDTGSGYGGEGWTGGENGSFDHPTGGYHNTGDNPPPGGGHQPVVWPTPPPGPPDSQPHGPTLNDRPTLQTHFLHDLNPFDPSAINTTPGGSGTGNWKPTPPPRPASTRTLSTVATGSTIPVTYGHTTVGGSIIFARVVGRYFYLAFALGEGPIESVEQILIDGRDITSAGYQGRVGLGLVENTDYFIHLGHADQTYDTFLHNIDPTHVTGWPGLAYMVARFPTPTDAVGTYDPTRAVFEIKGKLVRDMRNHLPAFNPLTAAAGSSGSPDGDYYYKFTHKGSGWETAGSPVSNRITLTNKQGDLSAIDLGPTGTTARGIYRTKDGGGSEGPFFYVGDISDNTTTTFTDNVADADLGDEIPAVQTEYAYSENGILHRFDLMTNVTFGGGIKEKYIDCGQDGTFARAADDCDHELILPTRPASAPTLSVQSAVSNIPNGTYYYTYTNVDTSGIESLESDAASVSPNGANRVKLSSIEVSGGSIASHRIYRNDANTGSGAARHLVDEITDGTTSYIDNVLPEALGVAAPTQSVRYTMSISLRDARTLQDWIDSFDQHYMGYGVYNSGLFQVFIDKAKDASGLTFTDQGSSANIIDVPTITLNGNSNNPNVITVTFTDASRQYGDGSASAETEAVTNRTEDRREKRYSLPGITSYDQAKRMAIHLLNRQHYADKSIQFIATPEAIRVLPGDIIAVTSVVGISDALVLVRENEPMAAGMQYQITGDFYSDLTYSDTVQQGTVGVPTLYPDPHAFPPAPPGEAGWYAGTPSTIPLIFWDAPRVYRPDFQTKYGSSFWSQTNLASFTAAKVNDGDVDTLAFSSNSGDRELVLDLGSGNALEFGRCDIHYVSALVADDDAKMGYTFEPDVMSATGISYSDDGSTWTGVQGMTLVGRKAGDRYAQVEWRDPGAHRYWKVWPGTTMAGQPDDANSPEYADVQFFVFEEYPYVDHYDVYDMRQASGFHHHHHYTGSGNQGSFFCRVTADGRPTETDGLDASAISKGTYLKFSVITVSKANLVSDPCNFDRAQLTGGYGLDFVQTADTGVTDFASMPTVLGVPIGGGGGGSGTFTYETPSGTIDSSNLVFTISHTPIAGEAFEINGVLLIPGTHYTRTGTTLNLVAGQAPDPGDVLNYRYFY